MGRFYETSQPHFIDNKMYEAPAELMAKVLMNKEKAVDDTISGAEAYLEKLKAEALLQDTPRLQEKIKAYEDKITGIVTSIQSNPMEYSKYQGDITKLGRDISADWTTGEIGTMQKYKKQVSEEYDAIDKLSEKDGYDANYKAAKKKEILAKYTGIGWNENSNTAGQTPNINGNYKALIFDDKFAQHMKANGYDITKETNGGNGYTYTKQGSSEGLSKERIAQAYVDYIQSDVSLQEAVNERRDLGLPGFENADLSKLYEYGVDKNGKKQFTGFRNDYYGNKINAGITTYAYNKTKDSSTIGNDSTYMTREGWARDDAKEARDKAETETPETAFNEVINTNDGNLGSLAKAWTQSVGRTNKVITDGLNILKTAGIKDPKILAQVQNGNFTALRAIAGEGLSGKIDEMEGEYKHANAEKIMNKASIDMYKKTLNKEGQKRMEKPGWNNDPAIKASYAKFVATNNIKNKSTPLQTVTLNGMGYSPAEKTAFGKTIVERFDDTMYEFKGLNGNSQILETAEGKKLAFTKDPSKQGHIVTLNGKKGVSLVYSPNDKHSLKELKKIGVVGSGVENTLDDNGNPVATFYENGKAIGVKIDTNSFGLVMGLDNNKKTNFATSIKAGQNNMQVSFSTDYITSPKTRAFLQKNDDNFKFNDLNNRYNWGSIDLKERLDDNGNAMGSKQGGHVYEIRKGKGYIDGQPTSSEGTEVIKRILTGYK
jgi:hypothetical protein